MNNLRLRSDLSAALEHGELFAYFQPQQELATGRIVAVEALCRWQHPVLGALSPELFIPMAEEAGSIHEIGMFMLEEGCLPPIGGSASTETSRYRLTSRSPSWSPRLSSSG